VEPHGSGRIVSPKPVLLGSWLDAFSLREPDSTSLENAPTKGEAIMLEMIKRLFRFGKPKKDPNIPDLPDHSDPPSGQSEARAKGDFESGRRPGIGDATAGRGALESADVASETSESEAALKRASSR